MKNYFTNLFLFIFVGITLSSCSLESDDSNEKTKAEGIEFLAKNKTKDGVLSTESGLQYKILKKGTGTKPSQSSKVTVHYVGTFINGEEFDSSVKRGEPSTFKLNQVISGWTEGLQLMKEGAKYRFFIPSHLAYGNRGQGSVKPFSTLLFDVELIKVH